MTFEDFIPPRAKNVLEVTGEVPADFEVTKEEFLQIQPDCKYTVAKNLSTFDEKFDAILFQSAAFGNLENQKLVEFIKDAAKLLNPHGRLIFTLDNIGYVENITAILEGQPLNLKVTLSKIELDEAISDAGLNQFNFMNAARRVEAPRKLVELSKIDISVFKYIISAMPEELPPKSSIQVSIGEKIVCGLKRVFEPLNAIATEPNMKIFYHESKKVYNVLKAEDFQKRIFINQRISFSTFTEGKVFFEKLKNAGYLYVGEIDDNPVIWGDDYNKTGFVNFRGVHAIQTSTEYLADYLRQFNPNVKVFANQLKKIAPLRDFKNQKKSPVRIFFGAVNRDAEFMDILPILNQFAKKYGDRIQFKIIARIKRFNALETKNKVMIGSPDYYDGQFVDYETYLQTLRESDIALLPLLDNEFNRSKSDLKFIECGACGAAVLASSVVYPKTVEDGVNGLIFNDKKEFAQKLQLLIENRVKRYEIATAAYDYVKNNRLLSQHYEERLDWYNELFERLDELNAQTQERIDEMAKDFPDEPPPQIPQNTEGKRGKNEEIIIPT